MELDKAITAAIKDLQSYPLVSIERLAHSLGISETNSSELPFQKIARRLLEPYYAIAKMPYANLREIDLAFARKEITAEQRRDYIQELMTKLYGGDSDDEPEVLPPGTEDCASESDFATGERWSAKTMPEVKIKMLDVSNIKKKPYLLCYTRNSLEKWLSLPKSEFRAWITKDPDEGIDDSGFGGRPSMIEKFYQLPDKMLITDKNIFRAYTDQTDFVGLPVYKNKRFGEPSGLFVLTGFVHGSQPATVYQIVPEFMVADNTKLRDYLRELLYKTFTIKIDVDTIADSLTEIDNTIADDIEDKKAELLAGLSPETFEQLIADMNLQTIETYPELWGEFMDALPGAQDLVKELRDVSEQDSELEEDLITIFKKLELTHIYQDWSEDYFKRWVNKMSIQQLLRILQYLNDFDLLDEPNAWSPDYSALTKEELNQLAGEIAPVVETEFEYESEGTLGQPILTRTIQHMLDAGVKFVKYIDVDGEEIVVAHDTDPQEIVGTLISVIQKPATPNEITTVVGYYQNNVDNIVAEIDDHYGEYLMTIHGAIPADSPSDAPSDLPSLSLSPSPSQSPLESPSESDIDALVEGLSETEAQALREQYGII